MATLPAESLRGRKRNATHLAISQAAIELGNAHGYDNVTVDMICTACAVSPRTFFNYFGSKQGVFLGSGKIMPTQEQRTSFVEGTGSSVFGDLFNMIAETLVETDDNLALFQARHQFIQRTPELLNQQKANVSEMSEVFVGYVLERYHVNGRSKSQTPDLEDEARMVVSLVAGAMRFAMEKWVGSNFTDTREDLVRTASELIQRITSNEHWP